MANKYISMAHSLTEVEADDMVASCYNLAYWADQMAR